jgi:hypothetical protein
MTFYGYLVKITFQERFLWRSDDPLLLGSIRDRCNNIATVTSQFMENQRLVSDG